MAPLLLAVGLAAACGGDDDSQSADGGIDCALIMEGQDVYAPNLEKVGANGYTVQLMSATPAPPAKGNNSWRIHVADPTQTAADGLGIDVNPYMPAHGHSTPIEAVVTPTGDPGEYTLDPVNLFMPGIWEVTLELSSGGSAVDSVVYTFCIDG